LIYDLDLFFIKFDLLDSPNIDYLGMIFTILIMLNGCIRKLVPDNSVIST